MALFDKVVWAAGENGKKNMPQSIVESLEGFSGKIFHSSDTANSLKEDVEGKNVLIVGGEGSAEDIALVVIRLGVKHIHVVTRQRNPGVSSHKHWPYAKLTWHPEILPIRASGRTIDFARVNNLYRYTYETEREVEFILTDIDTVVLATGYHDAIDMLEPRLQGVFETGNKKLDVPEDWVMDENEFSDEVGDIKPGDTWYLDNYLHELWGFSCMSIDFPSFFVLHSWDSLFLLQVIDGLAWVALAIIIGEKNVPSSPAEMRRLNEIDMLGRMHVPYFRIDMDEEYENAFPDLELDFSPYGFVDKFEDAEWAQHLLDLGEALQGVGHGLQIGTYEGGLSDHGLHLLDYYNKTSHHRWIELDVWEDPRFVGRTFRDYTNGNELVSMFTGRRASNLPCPWMDIEGDGVELILARPVRTFDHLWNNTCTPA